MHHRRLHRRLLRPGDLAEEHLRPVRLDPLPLERDRRRRRTGLLPAAGARNHPPDSLRTDVLTPAPGRLDPPHRGDGPAAPRTTAWTSASLAPCWRRRG